MLRGASAIGSHTFALRRAGEDETTRAPAAPTLDRRRSARCPRSHAVRQLRSLVRGGFGPCPAWYLVLNPLNISQGVGEDGSYARRDFLGFEPRDDARRL